MPVSPERADSQDEMGPPRATSRATRRFLAVLACAGVGLVLAYAVGAHGRHARSVLSETALGVAFGYIAVRETREVAGAPVG